MMDASTGRKRTFAGYTRHFWSESFPRDKQNDLVWVNRWYTPEDLRSSAPVQCHKFLAQPRPSSSKLPSHWVPLSEVPLRSFSRASEEKHIYSSHQATRSEEWSTLRQMLPSKGHYSRSKPPKWGTAELTNPQHTWSMGKPKRIPFINSPMTNYVDDMHLTNRLFRLH